MSALTGPALDPRIDRMSDGAPRLASISVLGGPLHDKRVDLAGVDEITIGADPGCSLVVELPGVSPLHAKVWEDTEGAKVIDTHSPYGVFVNMDRVEGERPIRRATRSGWAPRKLREASSCSASSSGARSEGGVRAVDAGPDGPGRAGFGCVGRARGGSARCLLGGCFPGRVSPRRGRRFCRYSEFVVAGFEAQWPETRAALRGDCTSDPHRGGRGSVLHRRGSGRSSRTPRPRPPRRTSRSSSTRSPRRQSRRPRRPRRRLLPRRRRWPRPWTISSSSRRRSPRCRLSRRSRTRLPSRSSH